ncbi:MAG: peptide chain release factor N(5)-glutamine methyltransferase [Lachnospiraceae bacterium]|nr:peptide chain release factor N(5)-glutamine methyltransferase [Lachnospiraceae bacterium]
MTYRELFEQGRAALKTAGVEEADLDARLLLESVCHTDRNDLLVHGDRTVEETDRESYLDLIRRRRSHIPLQYLTGVQEFMGLAFSVNENVLIPRQDTEILVEEVLRELHDGMRILDMCTGSGCILISLLHYSNDCRGTGVDISPKALETARRNGEVLLKASDSATWIQSDLFENVSGKYEFIVSNPPYIKSDVIPTLMPEVKDHEPILALCGYEDGLHFYRRIATDCREYLVSGGMLYFEIGSDQAEAVSAILAEAGFREINVVKDYAGLDRVVYGTYIA